ncbi:hypothetical protein LIER_07196 [Lithospermum erythrorhizon]|uniref:S-protein homolog n=1 Tax=Lithospermum erythrorhizon TaxID=34254 RepID=A0AAV3P7N7_LITER
MNSSSWKTVILLMIVTNIPNTFAVTEYDIMKYNYQDFKSPRARVHCASGDDGLGHHNLNLSYVPGHKTFFCGCIETCGWIVT